MPDGGLSAIGAGLAGASEAASSLGGLFGGGGGSSGGSSYAQQVQMAMLANAMRQEISDDYFDGLIGKREIKKGPRKGETVYGNLTELLFGQKPRDVFGSRPKYIPVDFAPMLEADPGLKGVARDVAKGNLENFDLQASLAEGVNNFLTADAKKRVGAFDPYLMGNIEAQGKNAALANAGVLPTSDAQDIAARRNELTGLFGTAGTSRGQVARDLGLSQLDLQTRIAPMLNQSNAAVINAIAPPQMRDDPRTREVQNSQAIQIGAADNQYEAEFDRREMNLLSLLRSIPDPMAQGIFNLQNTLRSQQFVIDFGLAGGYGVPGTMPDNLGGEGMMGFTQGMGAAGNIFSSIGGAMSGGYGGSSYGTPGIFG